MEKPAMSRGELENHYPHRFALRKLSEPFESTIELSFSPDEIGQEYPLIIPLTQFFYSSNDRLTHP